MTLTVAQIIDAPDPRRRGEPVYDHVDADDLATILLAYAEILERNQVRLTRANWQALIKNAAAAAEDLRRGGIAS